MRRFFPILHKELSLILRDGYAFALCAVLTVAAAFIGGGIWVSAIQINSLSSRTELSRAMFFMLCFALTVAVGIICTAFGAQSLAGERGSRTLDLLLVTRLSRPHIVVCKWLAVILSAGLAMLAILPVWSLNLGLGGVSSQEFWTALIMIASYAATSTMVGMGVSARCRRANRAQLISFCLAFAFAAGIPMLLMLLSEGLDLDFISDPGRGTQNPGDWLFWSISPFLTGIKLAISPIIGGRMGGIWTTALSNHLICQAFIFCFFAWQARLGLLKEAGAEKVKRALAPPDSSPEASAQQEATLPPMPPTMPPTLPPPLPIAPEAEAPRAPLKPLPNRPAVLDGMNPVRALERIAQGKVGRRWGWILALTLSLIATGMLSDENYSDVYEIGQYARDLISGYYMHIMLLGLPMIAATLLTREREEQTLDILLVTPLSPLSIVCGKFAHVLSQFGFILLLLASVPMLYFSVRAGFHGLGEILMVWFSALFAGLHVMAFMALYTALALFFSALHKRGLAAMLSTYIALALLQIMPLLIYLLESIGYFLTGRNNTYQSETAHMLSWPFLVAAPFINNNISLEEAIAHLSNTNANFFQFEESWVFLAVRLAVVLLLTRLLLVAAASMLDPRRAGRIEQRGLPPRVKTPQEDEPAASA